MADMNRTVTLESGAVAWMSPRGLVHHLTRDWDPNRLDYVERCELAAKLMALAEIIDPGDYETYTMNRKYLENEGD